MKKIMRKFNRWFWNEGIEWLILAILCLSILGMAVGCKNVKNPMAPDLDPIVNPPVPPVPPPPTEYTVYFTIVGETPELVECHLYLNFEDEGTLGGWITSLTTTYTWDSGRKLEEGEYTITITLFRHNLVPWNLITTVPFKFSFSFWTNDENVEVSPSTGDTGWVYFTEEGDYKELKFTVKEVK